MKKKLLTVGDSFTWGHELSDATETTPSDFAWPSLLSKKLDYNLKNLGCNSSSNSRIFRLAVKHTIVENYDLVICGWTDINRLDLNYNGQDCQININFPAVGHYTWLKDYFSYFHDEQRQFEIWMTQILTLQQFFKMHQQKYLFVAMPNYNYRHLLKRNNLEHFWKEIDSKYYLGWSSSEGMVDWQGDCPLGPGRHPLELGHQRIANKIYEYIGHLGWIS